MMIQSLINGALFIVGIYALTLALVLLLKLFEAVSKLALGSEFQEINRRLDLLEIENVRKAKKRTSNN